MESLERAIRSLLPPEVALAIWDGDEQPTEYPEEAAFLARAVPARATEFRRGRACARAALAQLGAQPRPVPVGSEGAPVWPTGFIGSITHCSGLVAAVAASSARIAALGFDAEPMGALPEGTDRLILHPLDRRGDPIAEKVVFSAKESIFKALFPLTGVWLDFLDVVVALDERAGRFRAQLAPDVVRSVPQLASLRGAYVITDTLVITSAYVAVPTDSQLLQ